MSGLCFINTRRDAGRGEGRAEFVRTAFEFWLLGVRARCYDTTTRSDLIFGAARDVVPSPGAPVMSWFSTADIRGQPFTATSGWEELDLGHFDARAGG